MKLTLVIAALAVAVLGGRIASRRLATHQRVLPNPLTRVNTQVHRINQ